MFYVQAVSISSYPVAAYQCLIKHRVCVLLHDESTRKKNSFVIIMIIILQVLSYNIV